MEQQEQGQRQTTELHHAAIGLVQSVDSLRGRLEGNGEHELAKRVALKIKHMEFLCGKLSGISDEFKELAKDRRSLAVEEERLMAERRKLQSMEKAQLEEGGRLETLSDETRKELERLITATREETAKMAEDQHARSGAQLENMASGLSFPTNESLNKALTARENNEARVAELESDLRNSNGRVKRLEEELAEARTQSSRVPQLETELRNQRELVAQAADERDLAGKRLVAEIANCTGLLLSLGDQGELLPDSQKSLRGLVDKGKNMDEIRDSLEAARDEIKNLGNEIDSGKAELRNKEADLRGKEEEIQQLQGSLATMQSQMNKMEQESQGGASGSSSKRRMAGRKRRAFGDAEDVDPETRKAMWDWEDRVKDVARFLYGVHPVIVPDTPLTLGQVLARLVETSFEEVPGWNLELFVREDPGDEWYCFEQLVRDGHQYVEAELADDGECRMHAEEGQPCVQVRRAKPDESSVRNTVIFRVVGGS
ncbi:hypothetical protein DL769_009039 [Monosporascus sp. CRB-8-3]|nr:hypothetical protein DL769_009039 [Monosporascus sp. CRB-8-3]